MDSGRLGPADGFRVESTHEHRDETKDMDTSAGHLASIRSDFTGVDRPLSDFQLKAIAAENYLSQSVKLPVSLPKWLRDESFIYDDLHYFVKYFDNNENRKQFLDGKPPGYNRLILLLIKLDTLERKNAFGSERMTQIKQWLDISLNGCPFDWRCVPPVLNHMDKGDVLPEDQHFFVVDKDNAKIQKKTDGDFVPFWMKDFVWQERSLHSATKEYWNARNANNGRVTMENLQKADPELCQWLGLFQNFQPGSGLSDLQVQVVRERLSYADHNIESLKLPKKYKFTWEKLPLPALHSVRKRTRKAAFSDSNDSDLLPNEKNRRTSKRINAKEQVSREKNKEETIKKNYIQVEPFLKRDEYEVIDKPLKQSEERLDPYRISVSKKSIRLLLDNDFLADRDLFSGLEATYLFILLARTIVANLPDKSLLNEFRQLKENLSVRLNQLYYDQLTVIEQSQKSQVFQGTENVNEVNRTTFQRVQKAMEEIDSLSSQLEFYIRHHELGDSVKPAKNKTLREDLDAWLETDINIDTGLSSWQEPESFLSMPLCNLASVLTVPNQFIEKDKIKVPRIPLQPIKQEETNAPISSGQRITQTEVNAAIALSTDKKAMITTDKKKYALVKHENLGKSICNSMTVLLSKALESDTKQEKLKNNATVLELRLMMLMVRANQAPPEDEKSMQEQEKLRKLSQWFSRYLLNFPAKRSSVEFKTLETCIESVIEFYKGK